MRRRRRALPASDRARHAELLCRVLLATPELRASRRIACYLVNDGEIDPAPLVARLWRCGKSVYLPVLHGSRLWFQRYAADTPLIRNRFGIPEPDRPAGRRIALRALDLVLMPLVAYDPDGARVGMGGGFYDRTFAYLRHPGRWARPRLVGLAHAFQRVANIAARPWDVPLFAAATERGIERFVPSPRTRRARSDHG